jgi:hypothetical protein
MWLFVLVLQFDILTFSTRGTPRVRKDGRRVVAKRNHGEE